MRGGFITIASRGRPCHRIPVSLSTATRDKDHGIVVHCSLLVQSWLMYRSIGCSCYSRSAIIHHCSVSPRKLRACTKSPNFAPDSSTTLHRTHIQYDSPPSCVVLQDNVVKCFIQPNPVKEQREGKTERKSRRRQLGYLCRVVIFVCSTCTWSAVWHKLLVCACRSE